MHGGEARSLLLQDMVSRRFGVEDETEGDDEATDSGDASGRRPWNGSNGREEDGGPGGEDGVCRCR